MTKYQVFDNDKCADEIGFPRLEGKGWVTSIFDTFEQATEYANKWLGQYAGEILKLNKPVDYSGCGDKIEIRSVDD